jgi:hypothetical protein
MKKAIVLLLLLSPFSLLAQSSDFGDWLIYFGDKKINQKWNWQHEVQFRNFNLLGDVDQLLLRTGFGYNLSENNNNLLLGYAFIYNEPYSNDTKNKMYFNEHRIYQQFITKQVFSRVSLQHRYRFEQRFFEDESKLRLRYFLSMNVALNQQQMGDNTLYFSAYNELFMNTKSDLFDRNRIYGGLGYRINPKVRTEVGVLNQSTTKVSRNQLNLISFINF